MSNTVVSHTSTREISEGSSGTRGARVGESDAATKKSSGGSSGAFALVGSQHNDSAESNRDIHSGGKTTTSLPKRGQKLPKKHPRYRPSRSKRRHIYNKKGNSAAVNNHGMADLSESDAELSGEIEDESNQPIVEGLPSDYKKPNVITIPLIQNEVTNTNETTDTTPTTMAGIVANQSFMPNETNQVRSVMKSMYVNSSKTTIITYQWVPKEKKKITADHIRAQLHLVEEYRIKVNAYYNCHSQIIQVLNIGIKQLH